MTHDDDDDYPAPDLSVRATAAYASLRNALVVRLLGLDEPPGPGASVDAAYLHPHWVIRIRDRGAFDAGVGGVPIHPYGDWRTWLAGAVDDLVEALLTEDEEIEHDDWRWGERPQSPIPL